MNNFFRKIRLELVKSYNIRKYIKYAIGEIILVVLGILIALQINNWNENRLQTKLVNGILVEIYDNLRADQEELKEDISFAEKFVQNLIRIETNLKNIPKDSLPIVIGDMHLITAWTANSSGFKRFSNTSTENIIPSKLRNLISENYNVFLSQDRNSSSTLSVGSAMLLKEYLIKHGLPIYKMGISSNIRDINVYDQIVNDLEFYGIIRNQQDNWNIQIYGYRQHLKAIEKMKTALEEHFRSTGIRFTDVNKD